MARTAPRTLALHALRLKGFADTEVVAAHSGIVDGDDADAVLQALREEGLATRREGRITGWSLTAEGRALHHALMAEEVDEAGVREDVRAAYKEFLGVNKELLAVCTDWQVSDGGVNDHADAVYDKGVVSRLRDVHARIGPVCERLAGTLDRFAGYGPRLNNALERVEAGEAEWFTKPLIDSYHTVWFELHEDLLCTLGIERSKEEM